MKHKRQFNIHVIYVLGGSLGPALFSVKGNQGEAWKPAVVRYTGTAAIQVKAGNCICKFIERNTQTK